MSRLLRSGAVAFAVLVVGKLALTPIAAVGFTVAMRESAWSPGHFFAPRRAPAFSHERQVGGLGLDCRDCHAAPGVAPIGRAQPAAVCSICHLDAEAPLADAGAPRLVPVEQIRWLRGLRATGPRAADP